MPSPQPTGSTPAPAFPLIGTIAPLVASGLLALVFQSTLALAFGLLGPVIALASWWEALRGHRRGSVADRERAEQALLEQEHLRLVEQEQFRRQRRRNHPAIADALGNPLWRPLAEPQPPLIRVGLGQDSVEPGGEPVAGIPLLVDVSGGLAVVGEGPSSLSLWRAVALYALVHAKHRGWEAQGGALDSDEEPPNALDFVTDKSPEVIRFRRVSRPSDVESGISTVLSVGAGHCELIREGLVIQSGIVADQVSFSSWRYLAERSGLTTALSPLSDSLADRGGASAREQLWGRLSASCEVDFVSEGPHALVWGQTGSGKTIALRTLLHSFASRYAPDQVSFVIVDFKGGTGVGDLAEVSHLVGVLTDLDAQLVSRAARAIEAEIVRREQILASHRVSDIARLDPGVSLARLIVVIDEIGLLLHRHPEWEPLVCDIAARGRALGVHLVIAGQRLVGQVPRPVVVNAPIRVCLRVLDSAEAADFLPGVTASALSALRQGPPGGFLALTGSRALCSGRVEIDHPSLPKEGVAVSLWRDPLPELIAPGHPLAAREDIWAVVDEPETARYRALGCEDLPSGLLLVAGDPGAGHSSALRAIAHAQGHSVWLPHSAAEWVERVYQLRRGQWPPGVSRSGRVAVLTDRIDRIFRGHTSDQLEWAVDLLAELAHSLSDNLDAATCAVSVAVGSDWLRPLLRRVPHLIALGCSQKESWSQLGMGLHALPGAFPPGRAWWREREIQFVNHPPTSIENSWTPHPRENGLSGVGTGSGVVVHAVAGPTIDLPGWELVAFEEAESRWREVEQARLAGSLLLSALSRDQAKSVAGQLGAVLPPPGSQRGWLLETTGPRLVELR